MFNVFDENQDSIIRNVYNRAEKARQKQAETSSKVTAEGIAAAKSVEEVLAGGGFAAALSRQPAANEEAEACKLVLNK